MKIDVDFVRAALRGRPHRPATLQGDERFAAVANTMDHGAEKSLALLNAGTARRGAHDVAGAARYYRIARTVPDMRWWFHSPYERWMPLSFDGESNTGGTQTLAEVWLSSMGAKKASR